MVPRRLDGSGVEAGVERNGTRTEGGVYHTTPPTAFVGVAPVLMSPCGKAPPPARGRDDEPQRPARCVTDFSAFSRHRRRKRRVRLDVAGPVPRRSRGGSRPLQHPRTFTAPSSRGRR